MRTHTSNRRRQIRDRRESAFFGGEDMGAANSEHGTWTPHQAEEQMLVNQALVEKIFACEQASAALQASQQQLHALLARQSATREDERKRLSRQLHDSLAQNLLALRIDIVLLHQHTTSRLYRLRDRIGAALDNVDITLRTVKELLGELRPACLELGLLPTVEMELRKFMRTSGIACTLVPGQGLAELALDEDDILVVHGVLQECLNNVARHSLASRVKVCLEKDGGWLDMRIRDNGIGFDPAAARKSGGYGLLDLQERIGTAGGELGVAAACGQGTEVHLRFPIGAAPPGSPVPSLIG